MNQMRSRYEKESVPNIVKLLKNLRKLYGKRQHKKLLFLHILAPVSYVRNVAGYDEKLRASNGQALREIYHFRELLREGYCTGVEKK